MFRAASDGEQEWETEPLFISVIQPGEQIEFFLRQLIESRARLLGCRCVAQADARAEIRMGAQERQLLAWYRLRHLEDHGLM